MFALQIIVLTINYISSFIKKKSSKKYKCNRIIYLKIIMQGDTLKRLRINL